MTEPARVSELRATRLPAFAVRAAAGRPQGGRSNEPDESIVRPRSRAKRCGVVAKLSSEPIKRSTADKPGSVTARRERRAMTVIRLGAALPRRSSRLPADSASSVVVRLFGVAPDGGCRVSPASACAEATRLCGPVPRLHRPEAAYSGRALPGILLCGARTFLSLAKRGSGGLAVSRPRNIRPPRLFPNSHHAPADRLTCPQGYDGIVSERVV